MCQSSCCQTGGKKILQPEEWLGTTEGVIRRYDTHTLLSVKSKLSVGHGMENFMKVVSVRNVIQMVSLMQNLQESQPFGDSV